MGFAMRWVYMILQCISVVSFSILSNGVPSAPFVPSRDIRQGDPLSPYLLLFIFQALSYLLFSAYARGLLHGIKISRYAPAITDILFADDTLLFARAFQDEASTLLHILQSYTVAIDQFIYSQKLRILFNNLRRDILSWISIHEVASSDRYLSLPVLLGR